MGKSPTFATSMVGNPLWMGVTDALLTSHNKYNWVICLFVQWIHLINFFRLVIRTKRASAFLNYIIPSSSALDQVQEPRLFIVTILHIILITALLPSMFLEETVALVYL